MSKIKSGELKWVAASGVEGISKLTVRLNKDDSLNRSYVVRLYFVEPSEKQIGDRVFDVSIENAKVLSDFDIVKETGSGWQTTMKEFEVSCAGVLDIEFQSSVGQPVLSGIAIVE